MISSKDQKTEMENIFEILQRERDTAAAQK